MGFEVVKSAQVPVVVCKKGGVRAEKVRSLLPDMAIGQIQLLNLEGGRTQVLLQTPTQLSRGLRAGLQ